ncbi:MAG: filamentous hemagglutinin N-terminal domain-containing protein [Coleofasciculus sp. D1-CHI-01]|uniref:two-partner secretion domain-containing protein n=1 Tax=Coleofasciculus sp. D1-CHI-01 TaxID=3068482 RepID=UPI0032F682BF
MERRRHPFWLLATIPYCVLISVNTVQGQIVPDGTLPTNVNSSDNLQFTITGGSQAGENLFHSFHEFSVPTGGAAWFDNTSTVQNIISRVTGDSISKIDGLLKAQGNANLFLLNPNGIIFGAEAALDLGGSFIASTANSIKFADGTEFSAINSSASSVLTVSVPVGLQFGDSPGRIINRSQASRGDMQEKFNGSGTPAGLRVDADKSLALVGGEVILEGGNITAPSGRIEVGSVDGESRVTLNLTNQGFALSYEGVENFQDIHLSQVAIIDVTDLSPVFNSGDIGSGDIQIQGRHVTVTDGSRISSFTFGSVPARTITVTGSESVELSGFSDILGSSGITTITGNDGDAGNIKVNTRRLIVRDGAEISTSSFPIIKGPVSTGRSGNLSIAASESVQISGSSQIVGSSQLRVNTQTNGKAGDLEITTGRLIIEDGGKLTAATSDAGQGGTIKINASDSVEIMGTGIGIEGQINSSALEASSQGTGDAGNLAITTKNLRIRDGGIVSAATSGAGQGGTLTVSASDTVEVLGNGLGEDGQLLPSRLEVSSEGTGDAGNLAIATNNLRLRDGGEIRATSDQAGGGNININAEDIRLRDGSLISASVFESVGGGGNIAINSDVFIALEDSDILANAVDGRGGNITIISPVFLADFFSSGQGTAVGRNPGSFEPFRGNDRVDISVEALGSGDTGNLFISSLNLNQDSLSPLSTNFLPPERVIADSCLTHRNKEQGSFIVTGTGGLPNNPYNPLQGRYSVTQVQEITGDAGQQATAPTVNSPSSTPSFWKPGDPIQEAQGMMVTSEGRVVVGTAPELVAIANADDLICYQAASQQE